MAETRELTVSDLYALLESISTYMEKEVEVYALGGTALTILGLKSSTKDVDFNVDSTEQYTYLIKLFKDLGFEEIGSIRWQTQEGFALDIFYGSNILGTALLPDCLKKSRFIRGFGKLKLYTFSLDDIIISKLARGSDRDFMDIKQILLKEKIVMEELVNRYKETMETSIVAQYKQRLLDLIEIKFKEWSFKTDKRLLKEVKGWE